ncbi:MAG: hyalin [Actinomycetota bacterium]|nr:hyalin [Actinomycetota bacterium]
MEVSLVKDIRSGPLGSRPQSFTDVNGTIFFVANDDTNGTELWKSDGTAAGTTLVKDINRGSNGSSPSALTNVKGTLVKGTLFFAANDATTGTELWKSDGTAAGTTLVKDINPGSNGSSPAALTNVNGTLFFAADDGTFGTELWKSDGTAAGTTLVKDVFPGPFPSLPRDLTNLNGTLFFSTNDGAFGRELWKSDGTVLGTTLVKDINPGVPDSDPRSLTNVDGTLFFRAVGALWKSDGTEAGTTRVKDINPSGQSNLKDLTNVNGTLFFVANDGTNGQELWRSDGTAAGTSLVKDINPGSTEPGPYALTNVSGVLFFGAFTGGVGDELWKSDGTAAGTSLVKDINPGSRGSNPSALTNLGGTLFFAAAEGAAGAELWKSDGTAAGTSLVNDIKPGSSGSFPSALANVDGTLFFAADDGTHGAELWRAAPDMSPPETTITSGPSGLTATDTATFEFSASEAGSSFACRVDADAFAPCASPHTTATLAEGAHSFEVRATDAAGNADPTPAARSFAVDTAPPETTITAGPSGLTSNDTATFEFTASEAGSSFACRLDAEAFSPCTSPHTTARLSPGGHSFEVRATDAAGNADPTPAARSFVVQAVTVDCGPETKQLRRGRSHTIRCTVKSGGAAVGGAQVRAEATGANDADGDTPGSPDFTCTTTAKGTCSFAHTVPASGQLGTTLYRAWVGEPDLAEKRDESTGPGAVGEPDGTDVVQATWVRR